MTYPLVLELAADRVAVALTCRVLGFTKQAFYAWRSNPVGQRDWENAHLTNAVDAHRDDPTFGYRFIADDLRAAGLLVSERRVWATVLAAAALITAREETGPDPEGRTTSA